MFSAGGCGFTEAVPCSGDALGGDSGAAPGRSGGRCEGGGGGQSSNDRQVAEALQSIAQALTQMQEAMQAMSTKMQRTDDTIRCVAQRLKTQGVTVQSLHSRMASLEQKAAPPRLTPRPTPCSSSRPPSPPSKISRKCSPITEIISVDSTSKIEDTCCDENYTTLGQMLLKAAQSGKVKHVRKLLDGGADANFNHKSKWTPLHLAAAKGCVKVVALLLRRGADVHAANCYGFTALHIAAYHDLSGRCVPLLLSAGADVDARNRSGRTPLHYAAEGGNVAAIRALKEARADPGAKDDRGHAPYDVANTVGARRLLTPCGKGRRGRACAEAKLTQLPMLSCVPG